MEIPSLAQRLSADSNACRRRICLCYHLGLPYEDMATMASSNDFVFFSSMLENWFNRNDDWKLEDLNEALQKVGAEILDQSSSTAATSTTKGTDDPIPAVDNRKVRRPSVLSVYGVGELPSTFVGNNIVEDLKTAIPIISRAKFEFAEGKTEYSHYASLTNTLASSTGTSQPFETRCTQSDYIGETEDANKLEIVPALMDDELSLSDTLVDSNTKVDPELVELDKKIALVPENGLDIPRIASFLSGNKTAYRKREEICFHLGIPHEDLQYIISLPPFQFFSKLLYSWELRDDAWAEIRLARALNHIGINDDSKNNSDANAPQTTDGNDKFDTYNTAETEPLSKRRRNHNTAESSFHTNPENSSDVSSIESSLEYFSDKNRCKPVSVEESSRKRTQMASCTSKLFGSKQRLAQIERQKHHLELIRSLDRDRNFNASKLARLDQFVALYLKATLNTLKSIPSVENFSTDESASMKEIVKRRKDLQTLRRVYKRSKELKRRLVVRTHSNLNSKTILGWNARKTFLQADSAYHISSCHI